MIQKKKKIDVKEKQLKPLFGWTGGKQKLVKKILPLMPNEYNAYYEPFLGGGSMFLTVKPKACNVYLNDKNSLLMGFWNGLPNSYGDASNLNVWKQRLTQLNNMEYTKENFYNQVWELNNLLEMFYKSFPKGNKLFSNLPVIGTEFQVLFIWIIRNSAFSKLCQKNNQIYPNFNGARGNWVNLQLENLENVFNYLSSRGGIKYETTFFVNYDWADFFNKYPPRENDFIYLDPPYCEKGTLKKNDFYYGSKFTEQDQINLCEKLKELDKKGVKWMLSNADTETIRELYKDYDIIDLTVHSGIGKHKRGELIIRNYKK